MARIDCLGSCCRSSVFAAMRNPQRSRGAGAAAGGALCGSNSLASTRRGDRAREPHVSIANLIDAGERARRCATTIPTRRSPGAQIACVIALSPSESRLDSLVPHDRNWSRRSARKLDPLALSADSGTALADLRVVAFGRRTIISCTRPLSAAMMARGASAEARDVLRDGSSNSKSCADSRFAPSRPSTPVGAAPSTRPCRGPGSHADDQSGDDDLPDALGPMMPSPCPALSVKLTSWTTSRCTPGGAPTTFSTTRLVLGAGKAIGSGPLSVAARNSDNRRQLWRAETKPRQLAIASSTGASARPR